MYGHVAHIEREREFQREFWREGEYARHSDPEVQVRRLIARLLHPSDGLALVHLDQKAPKLLANDVVSNVYRNDRST